MAMWDSENHQECVSHTEPQSPAAAPVSALMTTHMPVGHRNLLGQHIPPTRVHKVKGTARVAPFKSMPATTAATTATAHAAASYP